MSGSRTFAALLFAALACALLFLTLPIVAIFADTSPAGCWTASATRRRRTRSG